MNPLTFSPDWLAEAAIKSSVPIAVACVLVVLRRRLSAARRYAIWFAAILTAAAVPFFSLTIPKWHSEWVPEIRIERSEAIPSSSAAADLSFAEAPGFPTAPRNVSSVSAPDRRVPWQVWLWTVLVGGAAVQAVRQLVFAARIRRIRKTSRSVAESLLARAFPDGWCPVEVRTSPAISVPMLSGIRRPWVLLPDHCAGWTAPTLRAVLLHELAHFERRDHLTLPVLGIVRIVYWWHPAMWFAFAQLRRERERACDDRAVERGLRPSAYSEALLEVVQRIVRRPCGELAMARKSRIRDRVEAILDAGRSRRRAGVMLAVSLAAVAALVALFVGSLASKPDDGAARSGAGGTSGSGPAADDSLPLALDPSGLSEIRMTTVLFRIPEDILTARRSEIDAAVAQGRPDWLAKIEGVTMLSAPSMVIRSGARFEGVEAREYRFPVEFEVTPANTDGTAIERLPLTPSEFRAVNVGIEMEGSAAVVAGGIRMQGRCVIRQIAGFVDGDPEAPSTGFQTKEISFLRTVSSGAFVGQWAPGVWTDSSEMTGKVLTSGFFKEGRPAEFTETTAKPTRFALFLSAALAPMRGPTRFPRAKEYVATKNEFGVRAYDVTSAPWSAPIAGQLRPIEGIGPYLLFARRLRGVDLAQAKPLEVEQHDEYSRFVAPGGAICQVAERPTRADERAEFAVLFRPKSGSSKPIVVMPTDDARYRLFVSNAADPADRHAVLLEFYDK